MADSLPKLDILELEEKSFKAQPSGVCAFLFAWSRSV